MVAATVVAGAGVAWVGGDVSAGAAGAVVVDASVELGAVTSTTIVSDAEVSAVLTTVVAADVAAVLSEAASVSLPHPEASRTPRTSATVVPVINRPVLWPGRRCVANI